MAADHNNNNNNNKDVMKLQPGLLPTSSSSTTTEPVSAAAAAATDVIIMDGIQPMPTEPNNNPSNSVPSIPGAFRTGGPIVPVGGGGGHSHEQETSTTTTTTSAAAANGRSPVESPPAQLQETAPSSSPSSSNRHPRYPSHQGLVEALPVSEEDDLPGGRRDLVQHLEEARPIPTKKTLTSTGASGSSCGSPVRLLLLVLAALIFLAVCVGVLIGVVVSDSSSTGNSNSATATQAEDHTEAVVPLSLEQRILSLLPNLTKTAILAREEDSYDDDGPTTPQALAFRWLLDDPNLVSYTDQRVLQRFVLATIFFATGGHEHWLRTDHWLEYGVHECQWYHSPECFHYCVCPDEFDPCDNGDNTTYTQISIVANNLRGRLPPELFLLDTLRGLTLMGNTRIEGGIPTQLMHRATSLELLWVSRNSLRGTIPIESLLQLKNLTHLRLCCNEFSGTIPTQLGLFASAHSNNGLQDLILDTNRFTGTIPTQLGLLKGSLTDLRLQINPQLTGTLPIQFASLTGLTRLRLSDLPLLTGSVPSVWYQSMTSLKEFTMEGNIGLNGTGIPSQIGLWRDLQKLTIGGNQNMTAEIIPTQIGLLVDLKKLVLKNNNLIGSIPSQLGLLQNLTDISLQENNLTGWIPSTLTRAASLVNLELYLNDLSGEIPPFGGGTIDIGGDDGSDDNDDDYSSLSATMVLFNASHNPLLVGTIPLSVCAINFTDFDCRGGGGGVGNGTGGERQQQQQNQSATTTTSVGGLCGCDCLCDDVQRR